MKGRLDGVRYVKMTENKPVVIQAILKPLGLGRHDTNTNALNKLIFEGNKPSGRGRWASTLRTTRTSPKGAYSLGLGLTEPSYSYVRGLQARPLETA